MKKIIFNTLLFSLVFSSTVAFAQTTTTNTEPVACAQDAKLCPNGSYVGRVAPSCEFAQCPNGEKITTGLLQRIKKLFGSKKEVTAKTEQRFGDQIRDRVASTTEKKVERKWTNVAKKYEVIIIREENILAKIESRISKIQQAGGSTIEAEKLVAQAKTNLDSAKSDYQNLSNMATNADFSTTTPKVLLSNMKSSAKLIETHIRDAHKLLQKAVGVLRGVSQLNNATSTKDN